MRILLVNPNTTEAVTERMADAARGIAAVGTEIVPITARFGATIIGSRVETAISAAAVIDRLSETAAGCDGVIIAASVDSGLAAAREMLGVPVVGITEAVLHAACLLGGRYGAVVLGAGSGSILREMADAYGVGSRLAAIRTLGMTPLALLADLPAALRAIEEAATAMVTQDGVDAVVLTGAVMAGLPPQLRGLVPVPVLEGVTAAVTLAEALVRLGCAAPRAGSYVAPPAERVAAALAFLSKRGG